MASNTLNIPPHYLANTAAALGTFMVAQNMYGAINPRSILSALGFALPSTAQTDPPTLALVEGMTRMFATTRVSLALTMLATWYYKDYRVLGWTMLASSIMAMSDGFVSLRVSGRGQWLHWGALPVSFGVGFGLLAS